MQFKVHCLAQNNVDSRVLAAHHRVFTHFDTPVQYATGLANAITHGDWMTETCRQNTADVAVFFDVDCVPCNATALADAVQYCLEFDSFIGIAQVSNHIAPRSHIYAAPSFLALSRSCYESLGRPALTANPRADVGEELSYAAEEKNLTYRCLYPTAFDAISPEGLWRMGNYGFYGIGTLFEEQIYHLYQSRMNKCVTLFERRCFEICNGQFDVSNMYSSRAHFRDETKTDALAHTPVYVINLDRRPERFTQTKEELKRAGFQYVQRIPAFDGKMWRVCHQPEKIGCYMSHWAAWTKMVENGTDMALIVEDDVVFRPNVLADLRKAVAELPADWQLLNLHATRAAHTPRGQYVVELQNRGWGSHAYLLKNDGARALMRFRVEGAVDHIVMHDCREVGVTPYGIHPNRTLAFQRGDSSDIPSSAQLSFWKSQQSSVLQQPESKPPMKIAVYALAKNEEKHAAAWAEACKEADYRVVTDTGSTDKTVDILRAAGVTVTPGNVVPWRWDEAHNLSMHHVPSDADVCVRLDLDERFKPGWRQAIERDWKPGTTKLRYMYTWSMTPDGKPLKKFPADRVHARSGYRWTGATHEGLVKWNGPEVFGWSNELEIVHHRDMNKTHSADLSLLQIAVQELPHDARMHWYLARQMDYENHADTIATTTKYLDMAGGSAIERAYACRILARRIPDKAEYWLQRSIQEDPNGPDGYYELAKRAHEKKDCLSAFFWSKQAVEKGASVMVHTSDTTAFGHIPADIASVNAFLLGLPQESLRFIRIAVERNPDDERLQRNLAQLEAQLAAH